MPTVLVFLFWLWVAGSVVAYFVMKLRKSATSSTEIDGPSGQAPTMPVDPDFADQFSIESPQQELVPAVATALAEAGFDAPDRGIPSELANAAVDSLVDAPHPSDDLDRLEPAVAAVIRQERAASGMTAGTEESRPAVPLGTRAPLVETLHGIAMPVDLAPLSNLGEVPLADVNRDRLVMRTSGHDIGDVAAALRAELERLDLEVAMIDDTTTIAHRGDRAVEIRLYDNPTDERTESGPMFPTAQDGDVVVEFLAS